MIYLNKIILVGNGFDVSHNLKTKFSDFANYLLKSIAEDILKLIYDHEHTSEYLNSNAIALIRQRYINNQGRSDIWSRISNAAKLNSPEELKLALDKNLIDIHNILINKFLGKLFQGNYSNWFDIENAYFEELKNAKRTYLDQRNIRTIKDHLSTLNGDFSQIKDWLEMYLGKIDVKKDSAILNFLERLTKDISNAYFINFNYTDSLLQYISDLSNNNIIVNHIHGKLETQDIVFGYGNDQNEDYKEMKNLELKEFLEHFKTFKYMTKAHYSKIYSDALDQFPNYEVHVLGHSLGSTDKTLLDEILNREECDKIYLYKRGDLKEKPALMENSYIRLLNSASRIMTDEKIMRRKIQSYPSSSHFPN